MPRLAVTGASGFVGRHLASLAYAEKWDVVGVARATSSAGRIRSTGARVHLAEALTAEALAPAFEGAEAVVHLAHIGRERDSSTYESVNVEGTRQVALAARQAGVPRVVMFSGLGVARYGMGERTTNAYFRSKLAAEAELYLSGGEVVVLRPSYVVGPGDGLVRTLLAHMSEGELEVPGDGAYRLQPIAVRDAAAAALAAARFPLGNPPAGRRHRVYDLVGPEPLTYRAFTLLVGAAAARLKRVGEWTVRPIPVAEAEARARTGGFQGMPPDELDCLLCDEVADPRPVESLLGRFLTPVTEAVEAAVRGTRLP